MRWWWCNVFFHFEISWRMWRKNTTLKLHLILCFFFISYIRNYRLFLLSSCLLLFIIFIRSPYLYSTRALEKIYLSSYILIKCNNTLCLLLVLLFFFSSLSSWLMQIYEEEEEEEKEEAKEKEKTRDAMMTKYT